jgi:hypothetical protein
MQVLLRFKFVTVVAIVNVDEKYAVTSQSVVCGVI